MYFPFMSYITCVDSDDVPLEKETSRFIKHLKT